MEQLTWSRIISHGCISCRVYSADVLNIAIAVLQCAAFHVELNNFVLAKGSRQQSAVDITQEMEEAKNEEPVGWLRQSCSAGESSLPTTRERRITIRTRRTRAS